MPSSVSTAFAAIRDTRVPSRTVPGGSVAASRSGSRAAPPTGRQVRPRAKPRSTRSATRLDEVSSGSESSAASSGRRKPSTVRGAKPRAASASAALVSVRAASREIGVAARRLRVVPSRALSSAEPIGARAELNAARAPRGSPTR